MAHPFNPKRGRKISVFKVNLLYRLNSRTPGTTYLDPLPKEEKEEKKEKRGEGGGAAARGSLNRMNGERRNVNFLLRSLAAKG